MTVKTAKPCGCLEQIWSGKKARRECEHGNLFLGKQLGYDVTGLPSGPTTVMKEKPRRSSLKRSEPKRDWTLAIAKKEDEGDACRVCGDSGTECAHILGRRHDRPVSPGSKTLLVLPDRIVPLCPIHHRRYDAHEMDLLQYLDVAEQAQAILDAGSIGLALKRISPSLELVAS